MLDTKETVLCIVEGTRYKRDKREVQFLLYDAEAVAEDPTRYHVIDWERARPYAESLIRKLRNGTWKHRQPKYRRQYCSNRTSGKGKWRDLYIPCLDDHIIGHMAMNASMEAFTRGMHPDCCGSVPDRGIKHILERVRPWMLNDRQCRYFVKLDIRHFFDTIDRDLLMQKLESKIKDKYVLAVFRQIIWSAPTACPVGYYTSPWLANLFLEDLDWYIEQELYKVRRGKRIPYVRHQIRYVDDILLIGTSEKDLRTAIRMIQNYLREKKHLEIKTNWEIKRIGKHEAVNGKRRMVPGTYWCDIGGYKFCKDSVIMRDGIYLDMRRLARRMGKAEYQTAHQKASMNSKLAWAEKCDTWQFVETEIMPYVTIENRRKNHVEKNRKRRGCKAGGTGDLRQQCDSEERLPEN